MDKKQSRLRRATRTRKVIERLEAVSLCVHRTANHIYAQIISADRGQTLVSASSVDKAFKAQNNNGGNIAAAQVIGQLIAERAKEKGIEQVAFDRSGFKYHGRVKALAEAAREHGLKF